MTSSRVKDLIRTTLDESRMPVLVAQVMIGFEFQAVYQPGFAKLSSSAKNVHLASASLLLLTLVLLLAIPAFHRIAGGGRDGIPFRNAATLMMDCALLPFAISIGLTAGEVANLAIGKPQGPLFGMAAGALAPLFWYGIPLTRRNFLSLPRPEGAPMKNQPLERLPLNDRIMEVLTECRIVLPGTQALLGFQFVSFLTDAFEKLSQSMKILHLAALCFILFSAIFLMTAPAYHRLAEKGRDSEPLYRLLCRLLLAALGFLGIGISLDFPLLVRMAGSSWNAAVSAGAGILLLFLLFWHALPRFAPRG